MTTPALEEFRERLRFSHLGWPVSLDFTYTTVRRLITEKVPGCLVECGVAYGAQPAMMARALQDADEDRVVHLFDSFQGLPHAGPRDRDFIAAGYGDGSGRLDPINVAVATLDTVQANLRNWGVSDVDFVFHPGWYQHTLAAAAKSIGPIAFLRLDSDLYESTRICLEHLYPLLSHGGVCVVDDYGLDGCRAAVDEYRPPLGKPRPRLRRILSKQELAQHDDRYDGVWWRK